MKRLGYVAGTLLTALLGVLLLSAFSTSTAQAQVVATSHTITAPLTATTSNGDTFAGTFTISKFVARHNTILATGKASGTLKNAAGSVIGTVSNMRLAMPVTGGIPALASASTTNAAPALACNVLNLVLGPLDLNLLGLVVHLNTVVLNITAVPGGGLLGNLLCSLAGLTPGTPLGTITGLLNQILAALGL